jgi:tripartite-type tricarboxylate transporter receptor subunit TctC
MPPWKTVTALLTVCAALLAGAPASSQAPRNIKIIVPLAAGGGADFVARLVGEQVSRMQRATVVIENRPGAGMAIGTEAAARAAPDGGTLLLTNAGFVLNPHLRKVSYDALAFEPVCNLVSFPLMIVVNASSVHRTLADLIGAARAKPGALTLASAGPGTPSQVAYEVLRRLADVQMTYVPYPGTAPAVTALLGGHVDAVYSDFQTVVEQVSGGSLRALAIGSRMRVERLPDVPTFAEAGYRDYEADSWNGLVAPARTPPAVLAELSRWFRDAIMAPELRPKLDSQGLFPVGMCGADYGALLRRQYDAYGRVVREANIKAE